MADLTLHDYRDFSEEELRRTLQEEALSICGDHGVAKKNVWFSFFDSGGRRSGTDRRRFSYTVFIPERRHIKDRRKNSVKHDKQTKYITPIKKKFSG